MSKIVYSWIFLFLILENICVLKILADPDSSGQLKISLTTPEDKEKTNENVPSNTNEDITTNKNEETQTWSAQIINNDPSSGIQILSAPDLAKEDPNKNDQVDKHIENAPNFGKLILDSDPWVENFIAKIEGSNFKNIIKNSLKEYEESEQTLNQQFKESKISRTPEELEAYNIYLKAHKVLTSYSGNKKEGYKLLSKAVELNSPEAKLALAWDRLLGNKWINQDISSANQTFHELAETGNPGAQMGLGFLYSAGIGVNVSQAKSLLYYTFGAIGGDSWAQLAIGYRYYAGISVASSCEKALDFYKIAAARVAKEITLSGGPMIHRIRLMEDGESPGLSGGIVDKDLFEYYQLLADKGDVTAQVGLGQLHYQGGRGIPLDYVKAHRYFLQAAEANNPIALGFLGKMYLEGNDFVKQDNKTAFMYFKKSADQNNPVGQSGLGLMYLRGQGVEQDYSEAFRYFQKAAEQGWVDGQLHLGVMYHSGLGVRRDYKVAIKYFNLASQSGNVLAFYNLAHMHATGTGLMRSCSTAVDLYKNVVERGRWGEKLMEAFNHYRDGSYSEAFVTYALLAELGYDVAQSNAAYMLDKGDATLWEDETERYARAIVYWSRSAAQGYSPAQVRLGDYHYYGLGTPIDYEVAAMHYRLASEAQHNAQAFFNLGYMHEQGLGMAQDIHLAKRCYDTAAETSVDAKVPVALALLKLSVLFAIKYLEESWWQDSQEIVQEMWDLFLLCVLLGVLGTLVYFRRRRNTQLPRPHQD